MMIFVSSIATATTIDLNFYDDFNRADNTTVGNGWVEGGGDGYRILSNQLKANTIAKTGVGHGIEGYENKSGWYDEYSSYWNLTNSTFIWESILTSNTHLYTHLFYPFRLENESRLNWIGEYTGFSGCYSIFMNAHPADSIMGLSLLLFDNISIFGATIASSSTSDLGTSNIGTHKVSLKKINSTHWYVQYYFNDVSKINWTFAESLMSANAGFEPSAHHTTDTNADQQNYWDYTNITWQYDELPSAPPVLSDINCTSCVDDPTPNVAPYTTTDISPTFTFTTDINADCKFYTADQNHTTMPSDALCSGDGTTSHTCTLNESGGYRVTDIVEKLYFACASGGYENATSSTPDGIEMDEWSLGVVLSNNMTVSNSSNPVSIGDLNFTDTDSGTFGILTNFTVTGATLELTGGYMYMPDEYQLVVET